MYRFIPPFGRSGTIWFKCNLFIDRRRVYFLYLVFGFRKSTRPIMAHERTAICKSQLEAIIKKPGNTRGVGTSFWSLICRRAIPGLVSSSISRLGHTQKSKF